MGINCFKHTVAVTVNRLMTWSFFIPLSVNVSQETQFIKSKIYQIKKKKSFGYDLFKSRLYKK